MKNKFSGAKKNLLYGLLALFALIIIAAGSNFLSRPQNLDVGYQDNKIEYSENDQFRNLAIKFVRETIEDQSIQCPEELEIEGEWDIQVFVYFQGDNFLFHYNAYQAHPIYFYVD